MSSDFQPRRRPRDDDSDEEKLADKRNARHQNWEQRQERSRTTRGELRELEDRLDELREKLSAEDRKPLDEETEFSHFNQLPLSQRTLMGLERGNYKKLTPIQVEALPLALTGFDVLGAAKTGSGKTLCFVIPLLERLHLAKWDPEAGVGGIILSPTRELALQIFKVLQVVGYKHTFSAALLTGGRDVNEEKKRLHVISIIVGTPGRILHHLRDGGGLSTDNLQMFVMDEADRLLDMGFRESLNGILEFLPPSRQTLLFSATQTTDVQMLAQMSLKNPKYVAAHMLQSAAPTPSRLCQNFIVLELHRKLDALLMFLKRHPNDKVVVFVSTCNQVKYMYLAFSKILKKMRIASMCLTSKMKQFRREEVFTTFCRCKTAVLFCTDVASRGLDFPMVHWVIQYDCPDSAQTYIHRAGRTARAGARGVSLLFLTPSETPMLSYLHHKKIPLREIQIKTHLMNESKEIFVALVVQGLKYEAQKAFIAYLRSVFFAANKNVFKLDSIDVEKFALSLGLRVVPNMSELTNLQRGSKNLPWDVVNYIAKREAAAGGGASAKDRTRKERHLAASDMFRLMEQKQKYANVDEQHERDEEQEDDGDDMGFLVKQPKKQLGGSAADAGRGGAAAAAPTAAEAPLTYEERLAGLSKAKKRRLIESADIKIKDLGLSKRTVFDAANEEGWEEDTGKPIPMPLLHVGSGSSKKEDEDDEESDTDSEENGDDYATRLRSRLAAVNADDAQRMKLLRRQRQLKREGRLDANAVGGGAAAAGSAKNKKKDGDDSSSEEEDDTFGMNGDYDSDSSNGSLSELLKAARGELYEKPDPAEDKENTDASDEQDVEEKQVVAPPKKKLRRK